MPKKGFISASTFPDLMTNDRSGKGMGLKAKDIVLKLASELLGAEEGEQLTPYACQWGIDNEPNAAKVYANRMFAKPIVAKWETAKELPYVGGTIDRLIGKDGGLEIKCPATFSRHLKQDELLKTYWYQVHGYMWIYNLNWIDFCNYDPRYPSPYDLITTRVEKDYDIIDQLQERCELAWSEANKIVKDIKERL